MIEIPEEEIQWINTTAINNDLEVEKVRSMYEKEYKEFESIGLKDVPGGEKTILTAVRNIVTASILESASIPLTDLFCIPFGNYPIGTTFKGDPKVDIVGIVSDGETPEFGILTAWNEDVQKLSDYVPFKPIKTSFTYYANDKIPGQYNVTVREETDFAAETNMPGMPTDEKEIKKEILKSLGAYEKVTILEAPAKLSSKISKEGRHPYVNNLDIKCLQATIKGFQSDTTRPDGTEWGRYDLFDSSIVSQPKTNFSGWVDPNFAKAIGAGPGSLCDFYGTITMTRKGVTQMNVCFVNPLLMKPMSDGVQVRSDSNKSNRPIVPQITVVHPDGGD